MEPNDSHQICLDRSSRQWRQLVAHLTLKVATGHAATPGFISVCACANAGLRLHGGLGATRETRPKAFAPLPDRRAR